MNVYHITFYIILTSKKNFKIVAANSTKIYQPIDFQQIV